MGNYLKHFGLDFLTETEEEVGRLWAYIAQEGTPIVGYYGSPYLNQHFGDVQLILRTIHNREEGRLEVAGMDTHASGNCVWEVNVSSMNIQRKDTDSMERRCVVRRKSDGGGLAVINIVNADVLPSFDEGDDIKLQMIAFPHFIEYFKDEDAYVDAQPEGRYGRKWILSDGSTLPAGLLRNRNPESDEFESNEDLDELMLIRGTVKKLYHDEFELGDMKQDMYIRCIIGTEHGDLEIVHTIDEVEEAQRENICVGATVSGAFILSGDAAIYEYEQGIILDEAHDLAILRSTFAGADPERLRSVFAEDATYFAEYDGETRTGREAIIERLKAVAEENEEKCFAHLAAITSVDDGDEPLPYGEGKRCIVIACGEEHDYRAIVFADIDEEGQISWLVISCDGRYRFRIEERPRPKTPFDDFEGPASVIEPMLLRARLLGVIDDEITEERLLAEAQDDWMYEQNIEGMLSAMPEGDEEKNLKSLFGYLFAKAVETAFSNEQYAGLFKTHEIVSFAPEDAWDGEIQTPLEPEQHEKIVEAMELGRKFAKDFSAFHPFGKPHDDQYDADLHKALLAVQRLGALCMPKCME